MANSLLSPIHARFGDQAFSLFADDSGEPVNLKKMLYVMCPNQAFMLHFLLILSKILIYFLCHQRFLLRTMLLVLCFVLL